MIRWPFSLLVLLGCALVETCWGGNVSSPILPHEDQADQREFQQVYQSINSKPSIYSGAGAPSYAPAKVGDIYISTTTAKVYISTAITTSSSWAIVN